LLERTQDAPEAVTSDAAFREAVLEAFLGDPSGSDARADTQAQWAAVVMRECAQDALSTLWVRFCRAGLVAQPFDGLSREEVKIVIGTELIGSGNVVLGGFGIEARSDTSASSWISQVGDAAELLSWEELRGAAAEASDALTALAVLVELSRRTVALRDSNPQWVAVAQVDGANQPGLLSTAQAVSRMASASSSVADLLERVIEAFIIGVHETVAMSKLPVSTFRFFWEHDRLRFVDNGVWRFDPSGLRRDALATLSRDLGWWATSDDVTQVTPEGVGVITEVFGP
jgi:hypothetical protein